VRDGTPEEPESFFVVATGNIINTDQIIVPEEGEFIVVDWGHEPELVEGIEATIEFTNGTTIAHAYALDEKGARMSPELAVVPGANGSRVTLSATTLWYEFVVQTQ
jgi:hypothetical protein